MILWSDTTGRPGWSHPLNLASERRATKVDVLPLQAQELPLPQPRRNGQDVKGRKAVIAGGLYEHRDLLRPERMNLRPSDARRRYCVRRIARQHVPPCRLPERA